MEGWSPELERTYLRLVKSATSTAASSGKVAAISSESPPLGYSRKLHVCYNGIVVEELE